MEPPQTGSGDGLKPSGSAEPVNLKYVNQPGLASIAITNFLLNLVTLWFYRFWAKTRVRRHIWSSVHINDEPLEYTGTGKELFFGFLVIMLLLFVPLAVIATGLAIYYGPESPALTVFQMVITFALLTLYGFAIYRARRYRLSRTLWRGIRGALPGSAMAYSGKYFGALLLSPMTAGWSQPAMNLILSEQMTNDMRFGNTPFSFSGRAGPLYKRFAICWFLTLFAYLALIGIVVGLYTAGAFDNLETLMKSLDAGSGEPSYKKILVAIGIVIATFMFLLLFATLRSVIWSFYTAKELNVFAEYTRFPGASFTFNATAWSLVALWLGNLALVILTLGIAQPFVEQRVMRYFTDRLNVEGAIDFTAIRQSQAQIDSRGEGLIDALDLDAF